MTILIGILMALLSHESLTAQELADRFEVCRRSIFRYVEKLNAAGIPIDSSKGRKGGYTIAEDYKIRVNFLTKEEFARVLKAVESFNLQDKLTQTASDKLKALSRARQDFVLQSNQLVVEPNVSSEAQGKIQLLERCLSANRLVQLNYHDDKGNDTNRLIEPYSLVMKNSVWYVYAFCRLRNDFRFFKISRIVEMAAQKTEVIPRTYAVDSSKIDTDVLSQKELVDFTLAVKEKASTHVEEWLGMQNVTKQGKSYVAKGHLPVDDYLVSKLLSFGDGVAGVTPVRLKKMMRQAVTKLNKLYEME